MGHRRLTGYSVHTTISDTPTNNISRNNNNSGNNEKRSTTFHTEHTQRHYEKQSYVGIEMMNVIVDKSTSKNIPKTLNLYKRLITFCTDRGYKLNKESRESPDIKFRI